ncbi:hypothetical protein Sste5346_007404 [Sporothrix stenoceras]|uniref:Glycoprotease family protein n=1 Tax=Sporothrix stenoceras TaxID=5173 RepID=A0ABR3YUZ0_9PEZI
MNDLRTLQQPNPFNTPFDDHDEHTATTHDNLDSSRHQQRHVEASTSTGTGREEWEDWDSDCDEETSEGRGHDELFDDRDDRRGEYPPLLATIEEAPDTPADSRNPASLTTATTTNLARRSRTSTNMSTAAVLSAHHPGSKPSRLKSRARQKAQNAKAGIRLVTDMSKLRKQQQMQQQQLLQQQQQQQQMQQQQTQPGPSKFVDAAALLALEGKPSESSVGNWHWRRRRANSNGNSSQNIKTSSPAVDHEQDLSPNDRPIVIGISLPEDDLIGRTVSPQTATLETPINIPMYLGKSSTQNSQLHQVSTLSPQAPMHSVWSPDTEEGSPRSAGASATRAVSSIYSQFTGQSATAQQAPPIPSLPSAYRDALGVGIVQPNATSSGQNPRHDSLLLREADDFDNDTPITLFEEDGSPASYNRLSRPRGRHARSMANTIDTTRSGWWDHVQTPFTEQGQLPFSAKTSSPLTPSSAKTPLSATSLHARAVVIPAVPALPPANTVPPAQRAATSTTPISPLVTPEEEWWKRSTVDQKKDHSAQNQKPTLGISTSVANSHYYRATERSPTVASSSRSVAPAATQRVVTPRLTPRIVEISEKGTAAPLTGRSVLSDRGDRGRLTPSDAPPPYEPPSRPEMTVRYRAVFPPGHPLRENFPPSPGPVSPSLAHTMTSQGGIHMSDVPLTPAGMRSAAAANGTPLPTRPSGALLPGTAMVASDAAAKVERSRHRHEKEDAAARRAGGMWRGRGCLPNSGCFGRKGGRESRRRHRLICMGVIGGLVLIISLVTALVVTLSKKHAPPIQKSSIWLNITGFPPIPTGVTTVIGTDNAVDKPGCVSPTSLWSCTLPKEQQAANGKFSGDEPSFFIDIQFDNSTKKLWDVPAGTIPTPILSATGKAATATATASTQQFDAGFTPQPAPPSFQEMWFLGNTTDGIVSNNKAGEPTPFYITFLSTTNSTTPGPNAVLDRRDATPTAADGFPQPSLNADGTGAPAVMHPLPIQQPLRLYDRGLPTEHFGFYTYFSKTIYVQSITPDGSPLASDANGGSLEVDANHIVTWLQTRFLVQIWTRMENTTQLLGTQGTGTGTGTGSNSTQPGTFPYPISLTEDLHGGDFLEKGVFARGINGLQQIQLANASTIVDNLSFGGTLLNHGTNPTFGGSDGGTGGCQCVWNNFLGVNGNTIV